MNITKTECLEKQVNRDCVLSVDNLKKINKDYHQCASGCLNKCDEKQINFSPLSANLYSNSGNVQVREGALFVHIPKSPNDRTVENSDSLKKHQNVEEIMQCLYKRRIS